MISLWRFTHDYMEGTQGLHNLVWLFESGQPDVPTTSNYPGDAYVDVIGQDVYTDQPVAPPSSMPTGPWCRRGNWSAWRESRPKGPQRRRSSTSRRPDLSFRLENENAKDRSLCSVVGPERRQGRMGHGLDTERPRCAQ